MLKAIAPIVMSCLIAAPVLAADGVPQLDGQQANQFMTIVISKLLNSIDFNRTTISFNAADIKIGPNKTGRNSVLSVEKLNADANILFKQDIVIGTDEILPSLPMQAQFKDLIPKISVLLDGKKLVAEVASQSADNFKITANFYDAKNSGSLKAVSLPITLGNAVSSNLLSLKFTSLTLELSAPTAAEQASALKELDIQDKSNLKVTSKVSGNCSITDNTNSVSQKFDTCALGGYYFLNTQTNKSFPAIKFKISK